LAIEAAGLRKVYGKFPALNGVDLKVPRGSVFSLLGPNGAGKTTTVSILTCVLRHDGGRAVVLGHEVPRECSEVLPRIGVLPQEYNGFTEVSVRGNIEYFARLYGYGRDAVDSVIDLLDLREIEHRKFGKLSGGQKRKVGIACALVGNPEIVFLDEPTLGLDPIARREIWDIIRGMRRNGVTIFMTTHYMEEAETLSDRVAIIDRGRIIEEGDPKDIVSRLRVRTLEEAYVTVIGGDYAETKRR